MTNRVFRTLIVALVLSTLEASCAGGRPVDGEVQADTGQDGAGAGDLVDSTSGLDAAGDRQADGDAITDSATDLGLDEHDAVVVELPYPSFWEDDDPCGPESPRCTIDEHCAPSHVCVNTLCVPEVDPDAYVFADTISFVDRGQYPPAVGDDDCCFDLDGDGNVDNQISILVDAAAEYLGFDDASWLTWGIQNAIDTDGSAIILEFRQLPDECGPAQVWAWPGEGDLDFDGTTDQSPRERSSGNGVFRINRSGFVAHGAAVQLNRAALDGSLFRAEGFDFELGMSLPESGEVVTVEVRYTKLRGEIQERTSGVVSTDPEAGALAGIELGGYVPFAGVLDQLDTLARACPCLGVDPELPVIEHAIVGGHFTAECAQDVTWQTDCWQPPNGWLCRNLRSLCPVVPTIGLAGDFSTGATGADRTMANDAVSFGLRFSMVEAALANPILAPEVFAVDDNLRARATGEPVSLYVLKNDNDSSGSPLDIASFTQPSHGAVAVSADGQSLTYERIGTFLGFDQFEYTLLGAGDDRTAQVSVRVDAEPFDLGDDDATIPLNRGPQEIAVFANDDYDAFYLHMVRLVVPDDLSEVETSVWLTPDRRGFVILPDPENFEERTISYTYQLRAEPSWKVGRARVEVTIERPETDCGDGFIDPWVGEECDDLDVLGGELCDDSCHFVACAGEGDPARYYTDGDSDDYGDPDDFEYACEAPNGRVAIAGDCADDNGDVNPDAAESDDTSCADDLDNDCDGAIDCGDPDCTSTLPCAETGAACTGGADEDDDALIDCADPDCWDAAECVEEDCDDDLDNEGDGFADCADRDCWSLAPCHEELCGDGTDNDDDERTDCDDVDCLSDAACED